MSDEELRRLRAERFSAMGAGSSRLASLRKSVKTPITIQYEEEGTTPHPSLASSGSSSSPSAADHREKSGEEVVERAAKSVAEAPVSVSKPSAVVERRKAIDKREEGSSEAKEEDKKKQKQEQKQDDGNDEDVKKREEQKEMDVIEVIKKLSQDPTESENGESKTTTTLFATMMCLLLGLLVAFLHSHPLSSSFFGQDPLLSSLFFNFLPLAMILAMIGTWRTVLDCIDTIVDPLTHQITFTITNVFPFISGLKHSFSAITCHTSLVIFSFVLSLPLFSFLFNTTSA